MGYFTPNKSFAYNSIQNNHLRLVESSLEVEFSTLLNEKNVRNFIFEVLGPVQLPRHFPPNMLF